jgi:sulfate transport system ATP-binding protein
VSIEVRNVSKRFGSFTALDDVSLEIPDGSLTAVLGPSGSGKSTLLRIVAGLDRPDSGEIRLSGEDATRLAPQRRNVGFVFQHYAAFKHMTVRDNVGFALSVRKRPTAEIRERVDELLELVQLSGFADRYPSKLSGGQRQRMALARALAAKPRVLLLDEPFGALDARVRAELRDWLRRLHEEVHVTTVFVTHDQEEAMEVADRVAVFDHGRLEQVGAPAELYDNPASEFVVRFVGDAVRLGSQLVRPHEIVVRRWPSDGAVEVEVERIAVLGADVRVDLADGNGERFAARLRREQLEDLDLARGEIVWAGAEPFLTRDAEADKLFRSLGSDLDTVDVGATRAVTTEVDERPDGVGLTLENGLDIPVGTIPHPTGDTVRPGGPLDGEAESDALDEAVHDDV